MTKERVIQITLAITVLLGVILTGIVMFTVPDVGERSFAAFFGGAMWTLLAIGLESLFFTLIYFSSLRRLILFLSPGYLIIGVIVYWLILDYKESIPVKFYGNGIPPVSFEEYNRDCQLVLESDIDSLMLHQVVDTVISSQLDTIIYSSNLNKFFAIIINTIEDNNERKYYPSYIVGVKENKKWILCVPKGAVWYSGFPTVDIFKYKTRQYYYKNYSINKSSSKPEIWDSQYLFPCDSSLSEYVQ